MERRRGTLLCYGIVPVGHVIPVGLLQIWPIKTDFSTAEWGFVLGQSAWGTGLFVSSAELFLDFVFNTIGVVRLETRAVVENGRSGGALRKLGATREGILRGAFKQGDTVLDDVMWSILAEEWRTRQARANEDV
jgi:RimJ/RimL family protein N-acetyltransferase